MHRTRIKICGLTRADDVAGACALGADAIGWVFYEGSPRHVMREQVQAMRAAITPFVSTVALFMNPSREYVESILAQVPVDLLQFHGDESADFCRQFARPYIKAIPMGSAVDWTTYMASFGDAQGFLLDSHAVGEPGGSGTRFDWQRVPTDVAKPLILAGGLTPENVGQAVSVARPYGVDVSSGVEISKGVKDRLKIQAFIHEVQRVTVG